MTTESPVEGPAQCPRHRAVETYLRCSRCGVPICPKCLVHTPVGARCPNCGKPDRAPSRQMLLLYARAAAVGLGIAAAVGAGLTFINLSFLTLVPILLTG